jgi:flavorubredoxin
MLILPFYETTMSKILFSTDFGGDIIEDTGNVFNKHSMLLPSSRYAFYESVGLHKHN